MSALRKVCYDQNITNSISIVDANLKKCRLLCLQILCLIKENSLLYLFSVSTFTMFLIYLHPFLWWNESDDQLHTNVLRSLSVTTH